MATASPSVDTPEFTLNVTSSELGKLFYNELAGVADLGIPSNGPFKNVQGWYWLGSEYPDGTGWAYVMGLGYQLSDPKGNPFYAWAVSPGNVAAVPVPSTCWMFGAGLLGLRRRSTIGLFGFCAHPLLIGL
jgi:hypothetical protein